MHFRPGKQTFMYSFFLTTDIWIKFVKQQYRSCLFMGKTAELKKKTFLDQIEVRAEFCFTGWDH